MKDIIAQWEKLRTDAVECVNIGRLAMDDAAKRELFTLLAEQLEQLASKMERVITAATGIGKTD